ncbi:MAG: carbohydrate-binding module 48 [Leptospira sp.]|nr:carbohydrate-binding module 48 [Leptospira sp.]
MNQYRSLFFKLFFVSVLLSSGILLSDEAKSWIGGYSSEEWEASEKSEADKEKIYYQWQIDSLKRAISPRYIRLLDIHKYANSGNILNKGVLFTYSGIRKKHVAICGNFSQWECLPMRKNRYGIFYILIPPTAIDSNYSKLEIYDYKFKTEGIYEYDKTNPSKIPDASGSEMSRYYLEDVDPDRYASVEVLEDSADEESLLRTVHFKLHLPDKDTVAIIGSFNNWNYESDYLKKTKDGSFEIKLKLLPGTYHYKFIADGEEITDKYNPNVKIREPFQELVSELIVPSRKTTLERKY